MGLIKNEPSSMGIIAWHHTAHKPLPEPIVAYLTEVYASSSPDELSTKFPILRIVETSHNVQELHKKCE